MTFDVSTSDTTEPDVDLVCSQSGSVVYSATTGFYPSYPWPWTQTMNQLYIFTRKGKSVLATLPFTAAG